MEDPFKGEKLDIKIELAKPEDWQAYKDIFLNALENNPEAFQTKLEAMQQRKDENWQADLKNEKRIFVFAKTGDSQTGIKSMACAVDQNAWTWLISRVYTKPDSRGLGLAEKVLTKILEEVQKRKGEKARLTVRNGPKQEAARELYRKKLGFKDIEPWDNTIENSFFLEKDLMIKDGS